MTARRTIIRSSSHDDDEEAKRAQQWRQRIQTKLDRLARGQKKLRRAFNAVAG